MKTISKTNLLKAFSLLVCAMLAFLMASTVTVEACKAPKKHTFLYMNVQYEVVTDSVNGENGTAKAIGFLDTRSNIDIPEVACDEDTHYTVVEVDFCKKKGNNFHLVTDFTCHSPNVTKINISALTNVINVDVSCSKISCLKLTTNKKLQNLNCSYTELTDLNLCGLKNLVTVNADNCRLWEIKYLQSKAITSVSAANQNVTVPVYAKRNGFQSKKCYRPAPKNVMSVTGTTYSCYYFKPATLDEQGSFVTTLNKTSHTVSGTISYTR